MIGRQLESRTPSFPRSSGHRSTDVIGAWCRRSTSRSRRRRATRVVALRITDHDKVPGPLPLDLPSDRPKLVVCHSTANEFLDLVRGERLKDVPPCEHERGKMRLQIAQHGFAQERLEGYVSAHASQNSEAICTRAFAKTVLKRGPIFLEKAFKH